MRNSWNLSIAERGIAASTDSRTIDWGREGTNDSVASMEAVLKNDGPAVPVSVTTGRPVWLSRRGLRLFWMLHRRSHGSCHCWYSC